MARPWPFARARHAAASFTHFEEFIMQAIFSAMRRFVRDDGGVTAIEYGLIAALIGVAAVTAMTGLGNALVTKFTSIASIING
jgi:pilus assembly protein Flp/PilA